jgi:hypothetical protein
MSLTNLRDQTLTTTPDNLFAKEPPIIMTDHPYGIPHNERAELLNGRLAMLGFVAAVISYAVTGQIIPGVF